MSIIPCESDRASVAEEYFLKQALMQSKRPASEAVAIGRCLWCEEDTSEGKRWCDSSCRDSWQKEQDLLKQHVRH